MNALLLIAHGSRLKQSNQEVIDLVETLSHTMSTRYDLYQASFLEVSAPSISQAIDNLVNKGVTHITILPYFLNQGRHVSEDVPREIRLKVKQYGDVTITTLPYFGQSRRITELLVEMVEPKR